MSERMRIHSSGYVTLDGDTDFSNIQFKANGTVRGYVGPAGFLGGSDADFGIRAEGGNTVFYISSAEKMRLDSSARLLLGTTSAETFRANITPSLQIEGTSANAGSASLFVNSDDSSGPFFVMGKSRATSVNGDTIVQDDDGCGSIQWVAADGTDRASRVANISAHIDGTPGSNDTPGRLIFATTADGASTSTERMIIDSSGQVLMGSSSSTFNIITNQYNQAALHLSGGGSGSANIDLHGSNHSTDAKAITFDTDNGERMRIDYLGNITMTTVSGGQEALTINRATADGTLISFQQGGTFEGNIAVSGSTVSYNGGHLSRWSQTLTTDEHTGLLKGTVMTNLDEMCQWAIEARDEVLWTEEDRLPEGVSVGDVKTPARAAGFEDNEQLNKMAVSSVEGDPNVAGVMVNIDDDGDLNVAMTGDMVIRIAQGTTVARGDLLMSAGDGTAKPQGDDIVRSKTIAKVTSTTKSVTYSDGSYCVPCVLMAC